MQKHADADMPRQDRTMSGRRDRAGAGAAAARPLFAVVLFSAIAACAPSLPPPGSPPVPAVARNARIVATSSPVECVAYARQRSGIAIRGDAWTWWSKAKSAYRRGPVPRQGAVMVFRRQHGSLGHLAVVTRVVSDRIVLVDHANWLNRGRIHKATPVTDVSDRGDWSAVRVWHVPSGRWGAGVYRVYGFVYPPDSVAAKEPERAATSD